MTATGSGVEEDKAAEYRLRDVRLEGKTALITGGACGIGVASARSLASEDVSHATGQTLNLSGGLSM